MAKSMIKKNKGQIEVKMNRKVCEFHWQAPQHKRRNIKPRNYCGKGKSSL